MDSEYYSGDQSGGAGDLGDRAGGVEVVIPRGLISHPRGVGEGGPGEVPSPTEPSEDSEVKLKEPVGLLRPRS